LVRPIEQADDEALAFVAAEPLENLAVHHGHQFGDRLGASRILESRESRAVKSCRSPGVIVCPSLDVPATDGRR